MSGPEAPRALRAIALMEAVKGIAVLAASLGLISLLHHDVREIAHEIVSHLGMNPAAHYPALLLREADVLENANVRNLLLLALGYAALRLCEAWGLWHDRAWGEWLGAGSGGLYIPFEVHHFFLKASLLGAAVTLANAAIVAFLLRRLYRKRGRPA